MKLTYDGWLAVVSLTMVAIGGVVSIILGTYEPFLIVCLLVLACIMSYEKDDKDKNQNPEG